MAQDVRAASVGTSPRLLARPSRAARTTMATVLLAERVKLLTLPLDEKQNTTFHRKPLPTSLACQSAQLYCARFRCRAPRNLNVQGRPAGNHRKKVAISTQVSSDARINAARSERRVEFHYHPDHILRYDSTFGTPRAPTRTK